MRRIAVTGAGGFIGGALVRRLAADGAEVIGVDSDRRAAAVVEAVGGAFRHADVTRTAAVFGALWRAREELGWEPQVSLDRGMQLTEEWLRAEGQLPH